MNVRFAAGDWNALLDIPDSRMKMCPGIKSPGLRSSLDRADACELWKTRRPTLIKRFSRTSMRLITSRAD
jgi:hypothetical protein